MLRNYISTAYRNLLADKMFSAINIGGLALGLSACMLILLFVRDEWAVDAWIPDGDLIVNIESQFNVPGQGPQRFSHSPGPLSAALSQYYPSEIEAITRLFNPSDTIILGGEEFAETISYVDDQFFGVFDLEMIAGSRELAARDGSSILLNESMAEKLFGEEESIGKTFTIRQSGSLNDYTVVGVFKNLPTLTHLNVQIIAHIEPTRYIENPNILDRWASLNLYTYVKFKSLDALNRVRSQSADFVDAKVDFSLSGALAEMKASELFELYFVTTDEIYLNSPVSDYDKPLGNKTSVTAFGSIAVLILLIATINFMNLTVSRSIKRAREVCIRKVMGAKRRHLILQFTGEAVITTITALLVATILVELALPYFNSFSAKEMQFSVIGDPVQTIGFVFLAVVTGVVGGTYPALIVSRHRPARLLRSNRSAGDGSNSFRQLLVGLQFAITIALLISTAIVYSQTRYAQNTELGFEKEDRIILTGMLRGNMHEIGHAIRNEFLNLPEVNEASFSDRAIPHYGSDNDTIKLLGSAEGFSSEVFRIGFGFFETYGTKIIAGRSFSEDFMTDIFAYSEEDGAGIVVNEKFVSRMGLVDPSEAINQQIILNDRFPATIVGVVSDIRGRSASHETRPAYYVLTLEPQVYLSLSLSTIDKSATMAHLQGVWDRMVPERPMFSYFLDERVDLLYAAEEQRVQMFAAFSIFAVIVACMGLYGLASFNAALRTKEIGIRKILGATVLNVIQLLVWQFSKPVVIANLIAWPVAWYLMQDWLSGFSHRIDISPIPFVVAGGFALIIAWLTVGLHAYRVARTNPIHSLRYE